MEKKKKVAVGPPIPKKKQGKKKNQVKQGGAPRRSGPKGYTRGQAIKNGSLISPIDTLECGQGVLTEIDIFTTINQNAVYGIPAGLVSLALSRGATDPYAVYTVIYNDVISLLNGSYGSTGSRLNFANHIYASLTPKTVPYRTKGSVSYTITNLDNSPPGDLLAIRGKVYYMYNVGSTYTSGFLIQDPTGLYPPDEANTLYINAMTKLAGKLPHTRFERDVQLYPTYQKDVSAFQRCSSYYGVGEGPGSPYVSVECEVPTLSPMLGVLEQFDNLTPRSSRLLTYASGDACSNYGIGALDCFPTAYYRGAVAPIYKFLDIGEVMSYLSFIMINALPQKFSSLTDNTTQDLDFLLGGFTFSYSMFQLALRQQLLWMFADSQCLGQFLSPNTEVGSFFPLLCGSNCYPQRPTVIMKIPTLLNENLRMLKMKVRPYDTEKYNSSRNHITHIPVWGAFRNVVPIEYQYATPGEGLPLLYAPELPITPDLWDGSFGGNAADLNNDPQYALIITEWNEWIEAVSNVLGGVDSIGGDGNGSPLLQFTRYVNFQQFDKVALSERKRLPRMYKTFVKEMDVEVPNLERKTSKKEIKKMKYYVPPNSTIFTEIVQAYTGLVPITATHKTVLPDLILPVIEVNTQSGIPNVTEIQIATLEPYKVQALNTNVFGNRAAEIEASVPNFVVGLSGQKTAFADFVGALSRANQGSFFGDIFATVGGIATGLGFKEVGAVASTVGKVAASLNV
jgi:hypothetical protein